MELKWLLLLHSVYYRAFGHASSDDHHEQSKGTAGHRRRDHHHHHQLGGEAAAAAGMFMKKQSTSNQDDQMMLMKCGSGVGDGGYNNNFQMPLHYPRYKKSDYENMEEWKVDMLLNEYGLCYYGTLEEKRSFAMGAFLWPDQI